MPGAYAKFVADRWIGSDHDEAVELWNSLPAADRPQLQPSETELSDIERGAQISEGKIKLVSCGDADTERSLVLEHNGHALTFRGKGFVTGFSDTLWYGEDHFDLCHHLEGRRVMVRYRPTADASYAGEIAELGIRDDLPGPLEAVLQSVSPSPETKPQDQDTSEQKTQSQDFGLGIGARGKQLGALDILSDTEGVDFGPYLTEVLKGIRENWYHLIPESAETKKGKLAIEFAITKDGKVADMKLVASSGDVALDRPAWGSITASNPFKHLPSDFTGPYLALRVHFYYNPDKNDLPDSNNRRVGHNKSTPPVPQLKVRSGIKVSVYPAINLEVPRGESKTLTPLVTGTENRDNGVQWSVSGFGCSGVACGQMTNDTYQAPTAMPNPPFVTLTASSKADPSAKASVTVHIVRPAAQTSSKP